MECPADIAAALDGLPDILAHTFDPKTWGFTVRYRTDLASREAIRSAVAGAGPFTVVNWQETG